MLQRFCLSLSVFLFFGSLFAEEPSAKPPVLTGFDALSEQELQAGWIRPFDGITTYGWRGDVKVENGFLIHTGNQADSPARFFSSLEMIDETEKIENSPLIRTRHAKFRVKETKPIFDGKTLNGWRIRDKSEAMVFDGTIKLTNGSGSLESDGKYDDFVLQLEYKTDKPVNSGVFFRCIPGEKMNGYECQIFNNPPEEDYKKYIGTDTGGLFRRQIGRNVGAKDGVWNYITIVAKGPQIATWVNGIQVIDFTDERKPDPNPRKGLRTEAGTIQFQGHDETTEIFIRNVRIGEL
jgi:hypothetical protein